MYKNRERALSNKRSLYSLYCALHTRHVREWFRTYKLTIFIFVHYLYLHLPIVVKLRNPLYILGAVKSIKRVCYTYDRAKKSNEMRQVLANPNTDQCRFSVYFTVPIGIV